MRLEISKWNPFRFIRKRRGNGGEARGDSPLMMPESMGMMQDLLHDPFDVDRWFGDYSLVLRGEKKHEAQTEEKGCFRLERAFGSFQRVIPLPEDVDAERTEARFDKGVLTLRLPKRPGEERSEVRRIDVK